MSGLRCGVGAAFLAITGPGFLGWSAEAQNLSSEMFSARKARSIGSAGTSGRITTFAAAATDASDLAPRVDPVADLSVGDLYV